MSRFPRARKNGLIVETLGDEVLVYDAERDRAHCLNPVAAAIWAACDGRRTAAQVAARATAALDGEVSENAARLGLEQLSRAHLLHEPWAPALASRRQILKGIALIPAVASIVAPRAAQAASCRRRGQLCTKNTDCCSGQCVGPQPKRCR